MPMVLLMSVQTRSFLISVTHVPINALNCRLMPVRFIIYLLIILAGFVIGIVNYKKLTIPFRYLVFFLLLTFISEVSSRLIAIRLHTSAPVYHWYVLLLVVFFSLIFYHFIVNRFIRLVIVVSAVAFCGLSILNTLLYQHLSTFPSLSIVVADILIVIYSLLFFKHTVDEKIIFNRNIIFAFNISVLLYFTIQVFNWGFFNYFLKHRMKTMSDVGYVANVLFYSALAVIILQAHEKKEINAV